MRVTGGCLCVAEYVSKRCDASGRWAGKTLGDYTLPQGWTNYTVCFTSAIQEIMRELYKQSEEDAQVGDSSVIVGPLGHDGVPLSTMVRPSVRWFDT